MKNEILNEASKLWDYHHMKHHIEPSDIILVLGNSDTNTILRGIELYHNKISNYLVISGGLGNVTKEIWTKTEADKFADIAINKGVPSHRIVKENKSSNTGENYLFTKNILKEKNIKHDSVIVVTKPYMERRAFATAKVHWQETDIKVTSIQVSLKEYIQMINDEDFIINMMVGDLQRIKLYPAKGFQIYQDIPDSVWKSFEFLVECGYDKHLIKIK